MTKKQNAAKAPVANTKGATVEQSANVQSTIIQEVDKVVTLANAKAQTNESGKTDTPTAKIADIAPWI
jgi:hypothetical protein